MNINKIIIAVCIIGALVCSYFSFNSTKNMSDTKSLHSVLKDNQINQHQKFSYNDVALKYKTAANTNIVVNYPVSLSYLTKKNVYDLRMRYVAQSIFANPNYKPSDFVFGQIVDKKPWMSASACSEYDDKFEIAGPSEESRFINNPTVLVSLEYPFYINSSDLKWCQSEEAILLPKSLSYNGKTNEITVVYRSLPIIIQNNSFYQFNGINAKDFGYDYFYIDKSKSTYQPEFLNSENPSTQIMQFRNFIHLGSSCGHPGGCNNGSPRQRAFEFTYKSKRYKNQNAKLYIKLWKKYPSSPDSAADINEIIIIENI